MDWSMLQPFFTSLATIAIGIAVPAGVMVIKQYTGVQISAENEAAIRRAATTEAGKLITMGGQVNPTTAANAARKVIADLPEHVKAEGYTHDDIADMVMGSASVPFPAAEVAKATTPTVSKK